MHHAALDRAGPHDGDLDDEVVEALRLEPRQHLRSGRGSPPGSSRWCRPRPAAGRRPDRPAAARPGRAATPWRCAINAHTSVTMPSVRRLSRSILISPASSTESLFHCATTTPGLVACSSGTTSTSGWAVISMPPTWTERWRGTPISWAARSASSSRAGAEVPRSWSWRRAHRLVVLRASALAAFARALTRFAPRPSAHSLTRSTSSGGKPSARAASRTASRALVGDHVADHRGVLAAVALVDVGDHLVAAVGGEVDVDVGHGVGAVAQEALEEQVVRQRIDRRDAQQVGHQRVGRRAAPLAADAARRAPSARCPRRSGSSRPARPPR